MRKLSLMLILVLTVCLSSPGFAERPDTLERSKIDEDYKWDLSSIYTDGKAWEEDFTVVSAKVRSFDQFRGTLADGADSLTAALKARSSLLEAAEKVWAYSYLRWVEDTRRSDTKERMDRAEGLNGEAGTAVSWLIPELLEIPEATVMAWVENSEALQQFQFTLAEAYRRKAHSLDADGEHLLALYQSANSNLSSIYSALTVADARFPEVEMTDGRTLRATGASSWQSLNRDRMQKDRRAVQTAYLSVFDDREHSLASLYSSVIQRNVATASARDYESAVLATLDRFNIPTEVYQTLIETAHDGVEPFRRYHRLRKQFLGLDTYYECDRRVPLVDTSFSFAYDDMHKPLVASVAPLGQAYQREVESFFVEDRIDVYENEGKQPRNFALTVYGFPAFLKLNYGDTIEDAFMFAHEMGHGMHGNLTRRNQPFDTYEYSTFVAETASIFNESLLNDQLLAAAEDAGLKIALLQYRIDSIAMAFYEIAIVADFERRAHELVEKGQPVNAEVLQKLYLSCFEAVFGDVIDDPEMVRNGWSTWVHLFFDQPFYVFQYATSLAAATALHAQVTQGTPGDRAASVARYLEMLSSGASDHPVELLRRAGVDLTDPESLGALVEEMDRLVTKLEDELDALKP